MSDDGSDDNHLVSDTNPRSAANGVYASCGCSVLGTTKVDKAFAAGFRALAHYAPAIYSAEAYDAANTIIFAMKEIAAQAGVAAVTRQNIVTALHKITFKGITKTISFEANGNIAGTAMYINQVQKGAFGAARSRVTRPCSSEPAGHAADRGRARLFPSVGSQQ